jgi:peptidoglycan/xylan/chitin deacetylase (PgdA/CDA1 family)
MTGTALAAIVLAGTFMGRDFRLPYGNFPRVIRSHGVAARASGLRPDVAVLQEFASTRATADATLLLPTSPSPSGPADTSTPPVTSPSGTFALGARAGTWVPILMYHYIRYSPDRAGVPLSVPPPDFHAQMQYLKDHGYTTITMRDLDLALMGRGSLPPRPVALTFDDGYADFYSTAVPVMRRLGLTATSYIPTMLVGRPNYMSWTEIGLLDSQGFEIAAHSQFHVNVARVPVGRAQVEIFGAKSDLERQLGHEVVDWAYPYGGFNSTTVQLVQQAGYWSGATTRPGGWHDAAQLPLLTRVRVSGGESLDQFARSLGS